VRQQGLSQEAYADFTELVPNLQIGDPEDEALAS